MASATDTPVLASLSSTSSSAPRLSGALPGSTSTAVISWESVSTTIAALCPSNRRLALVAVAHLRVMHRHHPVPAHPIFEAHSTLSPFHVLEQQLAQQFRRGHNPLPLIAVLGQFPLRLPRQLQQPVRVSHNPSQQRSACRSDQSMAASPFTLEPRYLSYPRAWANSLTGACSTAASARNNLTIPSANRL